MQFSPAARTLKIKFANFAQITRSRSRPLPLRSRAEVEDLVEALLAPEFPPEVPVRLLGVTLLGVTLSGFGAESEPVVEQLSLRV